MKIYRKDAAIVRRSFKILNDYLVDINDRGTNQPERLIDMLDQFKSDFQHHEM